jgi:ABC-type transport system involved in multi-copper enzyme maturation permease subunit
MNATVAAQMTGADFLKLRHRRAILIWSLVLVLAPLLIAFGVMAVEHASNAQKYEPAGGTPHFIDGLRLLALLFGPLAAILIGVEAGTGDASAGVFRDLVITGRSRLALFASRVPAALAMCWILMLSGYLVVLLGTYVFAGNLATPDFALVINGLAFTLLGTGALCVVAVGLAALTTSKPGAIIALIAWQIVASPLITHISSLGSARDAVLSQAIAHFSPVDVGGGRGATIAMSGGTASVVLLGWVAVFLALGAWHTSRMDA